MAGAIEDRAREQGRELYLNEKFNVGTTRSTAKGRCLMAKRPFLAGETVLASEPYAYLLFPTLEHERCHECFNRHPGGKQLLRCTACKAARYCSADCQKRAWKRYHRVECPLEKELGRVCSELPEVARQDLRLLARVALLNITSEPAAPPSAQHFTPDLEQCLMMACHEKDVEQHDPQRMAGNQSASLAHERISTEISMLASMTLQLLQDARASGTLKPSLAWIRLPTYPLGAILNHSCQPNCVLYYEPSTHRQIIRCIRDIAAGEELCHSYIDVAATTPKRREKLSGSYFFECGCERCESPPAKLDDRLESSRAPPSTPDMDHAIEVLDTSSNTDDIRAACELVLEFENVMASHCDVVDLSLLSLRSKLLQGWILVGHASEAIRTCALLVQAYRLLYPVNHPLTGLQLYTLGNLEADCGDREAGRRHLEEAYHILRITHGEESRMLAGLEELLRSTSKESQ